MPPAGPFHPHLAVAALLLSTLLHAATAATSPEVTALMTFKSSLVIPPAADAFFSSWDAAPATPCNFTGVTCRGTAVTEISVQELNVSAASVPFGVLCGSLKSLARLSLPSNALAGTIAGVDACVGLQELVLPFNSFSGKIPDLSPLTGLRTLNLSTNAFSGSFPWSALAVMPGLQALSAGDNPYLTPTKSFPAEIVGLTNLTALYLSAANIVGPIPAGIGRLTNLVDLELADNPLTGEIPPAIAQLVNFQSLELYNCSLTGALPRGFGKLTKLQFFDASQNSLTGGLSELWSLTRLVSLQLFYNGLSGEVPSEFGDFRELVNLSLYSNNLTGELPQKLGSWSAFNFIDVSTNFLTGPIPPDMCKRGTMLKLLMLENNFSGEIPATYASCTTLLRFRVSKNLPTGEVPEGLWALPSAEIIDLEGNRFTGGIGDGIGKAASLTSLLLAGNKFSGAIPSSIGDAGNLQSIDVSSNELYGEIPASIGKLVHLDSLNIAANGIGGAIPGSLGSCSALSTMNLAGNKLAGAIPAELRGLTRLNSLDVSSNELSGTVPAILAELKLSYLNLSDNRLDGPVPPGLAISAYGESFQGNPGLCANNGAGFLRRCTPGDGGRSGSTARTLVTCLLASMAVLLAVLGVVIFIKKRRQHAEAAAMAGGGKLLFAKKGSWNVKSFRMMAFDEREIVGGVRDENLIGSGGSGNVYRVKLGCGTVVAVKHITRTRDAAPASAAPTAAMLPRSASASARQCHEFDAEVGTLSSIRHVNVVKLLCSVTSEDGAASLLVYEHLPNGSLYERLHGPTARKLGGLGWPERYEVAVGADRVLILDSLEGMGGPCRRLALLVLAVLLLAAPGAGAYWLPDARAPPVEFLLVLSCLGPGHVHVTPGNGTVAYGRSAPGYLDFNYTRGPAFIHHCTVELDNLKHGNLELNLAPPETAPFARLSPPSGLRQGAEPELREDAVRQPPGLGQGAEPEPHEDVVVQPRRRQPPGLGRGPEPEPGEDAVVQPRGRQPPGLRQEAEAEPREDAVVQPPGVVVDGEPRHAGAVLPAVARRRPRLDLLLYALVFAAALLLEAGPRRRARAPAASG